MFSLIRTSTGVHHRRQTLSSSRRAATIRHGPELRRAVKGRAAGPTPPSRGRYATDASIYQVQPLGVLVPEDDDDVRAAMQICAAARMPMLPRGAGSSQCGQTVGAALVIDHSKHLDRVVAFDAEQQHGHGRARHRARRTERMAAPHGLWFPVDVSTSAQCDARAAWRATTRAARARSPTATWCTTSSRSTRGLPTAPRRGSAPSATMDAARAARARARSPRCARSARASATRSSASCRSVMRRVGGYNVDMFHPQSERPYTRDGSVNFAHLLVGSEGTLAWTRALTLQLAPLPRAPRARRRQLPVAAPRDGVRAAHRRARAVGGRARRPHDDRPRARAIRRSAR